MKRLRNLLLLLAASFVLAACGSKSGAVKTGCPGHGGYSQNTTTVEMIQKA